MADINNFTEITENFDTIKTLLNSIRAQGILNTSDVDKLLAGINSKLEKLNTEEDIDLIKIFLTELKQNLDERHSVLLSKFGAIESLFSNLLKNSSEALKSSEVKELFDIVATNLSVFSREVVSQKETLSDITLRLDAMRSDDSQKKEIVKNISFLKNDLERLNNGFDSIVLSLNENFKTVIKSISSVDPTEVVSNFSKELEDITNSSNTILSAIQVLDKKNLQIEDAIKGLATHEDLVSTKKWISDLANQEQQLTQSVDNLADKYYKIDNLAEKIDASVDIIAGMKTIIADKDEQSSKAIIDRLNQLEDFVRDVTSNKEFDEFKKTLEQTLNGIYNASTSLHSSLNLTGDEIKKISEAIRTLDINVNFKSLASDLSKVEQGIKEHVSVESDKVIQLVDVNATRTLNELTNNADSLSDKLVETQRLITGLCEKSFSDLEENISGLRNVVSQIDENNVSANNAIFSNITDRLALFEAGLKSSLEKQENYVANSSKDLLEQISNIKDLSGVLDYKLDSSVIEINNAKTEFSGLKKAVEEILALDFVSKVSDFKVDLYAAKQELTNLFEATTNDFSEKFSNDLFSKYELLTSKLDSVETDIKKVQAESLNSLKVSLDNISSSLVDILSYVSSVKEISTEGIEAKLDEISKNVSDNSLNYIESVKDAVDIVRIQVENNIKSLQEDTYKQVKSLNSSIETSSGIIREDIKKSYNKLLEVQKCFEDFQGVLQQNNSSFTENIEGIVEKASKIKDEFDNKLISLKNSIIEKVADFQKDFTCENADKISEIKFISENLHTKQLENSQEVKEELRGEIFKLAGTLKLNIEELAEQLAGNSSKLDTVNHDIVNLINNDFKSQVETFTGSVSETMNDFKEGLGEKLDDNYSKLSDLESSVNSLSTTTTTSLTSTLAKVLDNFVSLKALLGNLNEKTSEDFQKAVDTIINEFANLKDKIESFDSTIDEDLTRQLSIIENNFNDLSSNLGNFFAQSNHLIGSTISNGLSNVSGTLRETVLESLEQYKNKINSTFDDISEKNDLQINLMEEKAKELNDILQKTLDEQNSISSNKLSELTQNLKNILEENIELTSADYSSLKEKFNELLKNVENQNKVTAEFLKEATESINSDLKAQENSLSVRIEAAQNVLKETQDEYGKVVTSQVSSVLNEINSISRGLDEAAQDINNNVSKEILDTFNELYEKMNSLFEQTTLNLSSLSNSNNAQQLGELNAKTLEIKDLFTSLNERLDKDEISRMNVFQSQLKELSNSFNALIEDTKNVTKKEVSSISQMLIQSNKEIMSDVEQSIEDKVNSILSTSADIAAGELQTIESYANKIIDQVKASQEALNLSKDFITDFVKNELSIISDNIEKESDILVKDLLEQMSLMKDFQRDEITRLTAEIEGAVEDSIYNNINELKSYVDIKTDTSILNSKLDEINLSLNKTTEDILTASNNMLTASVFDNAIADLRSANNVLITSLADSLNSQIQAFVKNTLLKDIDDKFNLFDKKFVDTVVDKYEEIKVISSKYNNSFDVIQASVKDLLAKFTDSKQEIYKTLLSVVDDISSDVDELSSSFADLKSQILNKSFDEAFQNSITAEITEIQSLIKEQFSYVEDISSLCCSNLPELTEMNALVKYNIIQSLKDLNTRLDGQDSNIEKELDSLKTDVITQFLNIFNQISFVAEQEEILDFIQEKHSELITILSHIVTRNEEIDTIKDSVSSVENKVDTVKNDIDSINEKITSIISSNGNVDYVYSLQDLESDIANLRLTLNDIKENNSSKELEALIASTNNIYELVESLKKEFPNFNTEEFKKDFDALSEDIVSISTRTNKLILASDESYKTLQENLQDFKLVINDLDERTRNFAHEVGIERIDNKLGVINTMIQNGAKTNQVFNQVFEYLAEWVDNAGSQISAISDKVETLDDIGQIKVMLEDLKAEAEDNSDSAELIDALSNVFEKQAKRISSLEAKLDRVIVETTINNKNNKLDLTPIEETLNRFLVAIDDKMLSQQSKIDSLESKLAEVMTMINPKDTAQLTKKVGGMDRQIAKLNKSIEKIASHVVEK